MPNVLFVVPSLIGGGAERNLVWLASRWAGTGARSVVATVSGEENDAFALDARVQRVALGLNEDSRHLIGALGANVRRVRALRRLFRAERDRAADDGEPLVIVSFIVSANILCALAAVGLGVPLVVSERNHPPRMSLAGHWRRLRRISYGLADRVVALTTRSADWLTEHTNARVVDIVPNPVVYPVPDSAPTVPPAKIVDAGVPVVLAAGKLLPQKGFDLLIDAFARTRGSWQLVILGAGDTEAFEQQAMQLGVADRVHLAGRVGNLGDWYARASIFVLSSRYEGFPNVLVEAMASGLPVVSADCETGPADIITPGRDGLLVEALSVEALSTGMQQLMDDESLRRSLGMEAVALRQRLDPDRLFERWQRIIDELAVPATGVQRSCAE